MIATYDPQTHHWSTQGLRRHAPDMWTPPGHPGRHTANTRAMPRSVCSTGTGPGLRADTQQFAAIVEVEFGELVTGRGPVEAELVREWAECAT